MAQKTRNPLHKIPFTNNKIPFTLHEILFTNCNPISTKNATLFMQNKPNLLNARMNVTSVLTKDYENKPLFGHGQNKPNQTQSQTCFCEYGEGNPWYFKVIMVRSYGLNYLCEHLKGKSLITFN
jgi:hypothetical protein